MFWRCMHPRLLGVCTPSLIVPSLLLSRHVKTGTKLNPFVDVFVLAIVVVEYQVFPNMVNHGFFRSRFN